MEEEEVSMNELVEQDNINIIPVQILDEYSEDYAEKSFPGAVKGKYYKQTYRKAWEQMPDFKGWLQPVEGDKNRAFCAYCKKSLHAHRLSLLKHTCTIRHQKAGQQVTMRKMNSNAVLNPPNNDEDVENTLGNNVTTRIISFGDGNIVNLNDENHIEEEEEEPNDSDFNDHEEHLEENIDEMEEEEMHHDDMESGEGGSSPEGAHLDSDTKHRILSNLASEETPLINTQVTDTNRGAPVSGLNVSLYKLIDSRWTFVNEGQTNKSGNFSRFFESIDVMRPGRYKLHYDVDKYFNSKKQTSLYPFIEIVFDCTKKGETFDIQLLLTPFGYTTYQKPTS